MLQGVHMCETCGTVARKIMRCDRCAMVTYCSRECQVQAWKGHKEYCKMTVDKTNDVIEVPVM